MRRGYHRVTLGKTDFVVDVRYINLRPIGRGAYGLVAAADDLVRPRRPFSEAGAVSGGVASVMQRRPPSVGVCISRAIMNMYELMGSWVGQITGRKVAIKRVGKVFQDLIDAKRILREIKLLRHLSGHDNIIEILDIMTGPPETQDFETLYIVTQLYECDLDRIIRSAQPLTNQHFQYFLYQILRGLKYIHSASVIHRDLKPSNLLVNSNCDLSICDFGLARGITAETAKTLTSYVVTRWYRAPEIVCEATTYGPAADVWSVGCIFGELLGRKTLFRGSSSRQQIELIISALGTPTEDDMVGIDDPNIRRLLLSFPKRGKTPWKRIFPDADDLALDLLDRMLNFDQFRRITVDEALAHPYLAELHAKAFAPACPSLFNFDFEKDYPHEMPKALLQRHMFEELGPLRAEQDRAYAALASMPSADRFPVADPALLTARPDDDAASAAASGGHARRDDDGDAAMA